MKFRKAGFEPRPNPVSRVLKNRSTGGAGYHSKSPKAQRQQERVELRKECY